MRKILTIVAVTMLLFIACNKGQPVTTTEQARVKAGWTSDNNTSNYTSGTYTQCAVYNNLWCANPGYQGIWANRYNFKLNSIRIFNSLNESITCVDLSVLTIPGLRI